MIPSLQEILDPGQNHFLEESGLIRLRSEDLGEAVPVGQLAPAPVDTVLVGVRLLRSRQGHLVGGLDLDQVLGGILMSLG